MTVSAGISFNQVQLQIRKSHIAVIVIVIANSFSHASTVLLGQLNDLIEIAELVI